MRLRRANKPPFDDGLYRAYLPLDLKDEMYADPIFHRMSTHPQVARLYASHGPGEHFIGAIGGCSFFMIDRKDWDGHVEGTDGHKNIVKMPL